MLSEEAAPQETSSQKIRIVLVDDHPLLREGISHRLQKEHDLEVVGEAGSGEEAIEMADRLLPDVLVMDIKMPGLGGLEATRQIKAKHPTMAVLILTIYEEAEYIVGLLRAGAAGYLLKTAYGEDLINAIRAVRSGELVLDPLAGRLLIRAATSEETTGSATASNDIEPLTGREMEVLRLAARGMSNKDIAAALGIGIRTVKAHLVNVFEKMRVGSRTEAVLCALRKGWIKLEEEPEEQGG